MAGPSKPKFTLANDEYWVDCPYDPSHTALAARQLQHLQKCRRNYLKEQEIKKEKGTEDKDMIVVCDLNATHHVRKSEWQSHREKCPGRLSLIPHVTYHVSEAFQTDAAEYRARMKMEKLKLRARTDDDDWEKEAQCEGAAVGYNPRRNMGNLPVISQGMLAKSDRKDVLVQQRLIREANLKKDRNSKKRDFRYADEDD